ncbi:MAG: IS1182 family transposase [bacterium]|nr:IS1182 family transposase [bacterium]
MLKPKSPQASFYGSYLYDRIVPVDHLLRKINQVVDFSFTGQILKDRYNPDIGRPAEDPEFMLRLCLLQYIYGDSDRQAIENARLHLAYKYFLGLAVDAEVPDYTTISYFRAQRLGEEKFRLVLEQIVRQCIDKGLAKGNRQIIDSTPIRANISLSSITGLVRKCRENVLKTIEKQDIRVAEKLGLKELKNGRQVKFASTEEGLQKEIEAAGKLLDSVTAELRVKKLIPNAELKKDLELLEKAVVDREEHAKDKLLSPVDPDARMGKKTSHAWPGYKAHIVIEEETGIITGVETTPANTTDGSQLKPLLKEQEEVHSIKPKELTGDKAYDWGENLEALNSNKTIANIALSKQVNHRNEGYFTVDDFLYDPENIKLMCPAGHISTNRYKEILNGYPPNKPGYAFQFKASLCNECPLKAKCVKNKEGRRIYISYYEPYFRQARERLATEEGKQAYRSRYKIEQKIADLTRYCGLRRCRYRGLDRAGIHTLLATTVCNIKRMVKLLWGKPANYYLESPVAG